MARGNLRNEERLRGARKQLTCLGFSISNLRAIFELKKLDQDTLRLIAVRESTASARGAAPSSLDGGRRCPDFDSCPVLKAA